LKPLLRSRGDLLALVDRCCVVADEIENNADPIIRGQILHTDAYQLLDKVCWSIAGVSLLTIVASHQRKLAQAAASAARMRERRKRALTKADEQHRGAGDGTEGAEAAPAEATK
jgi:hypothetical protein